MFLEMKDDKFQTVWINPEYIIKAQKFESSDYVNVYTDEKPTHGHYKCSEHEWMAFLTGKEDKRTAFRMVQ